ncbi:SNF2 domain-containing protein / helicase domain-containing protein, putative isoform 1 [Hibiscus syriacus]|uniref:SNF2 domain-containing protein / helicase domain-containing protein, putative isoform 1 n=1 Tax=Hibiscus syriacus TaxID=106335 RepID=A0A6A2Z535_HIBSY|nr:SNF2 domain-containing protein / helicase domain-containing protein, putative isoform 1 [Hibiscus syriacus]
MSTYYTGLDNQSDATPMIYMRESSPGSYPEAPVLPGCGSFGFDFVAARNLVKPRRRFAEHDFDAWRDGRNEMLAMHLMVGTANILHNGINLQGQGLSQSLGTQMPFGIQMPSNLHRNPDSDFASFLTHNSSLPSRDKQLKNADYLQHGFAGANQDSYGMSGMSRTIPNSKYVKAAQELLNEYHHQMQIVVLPFDVIAGDQNALENGKGVGITRLSYVEKQLRQQKSLQQLGLMQHAWRPQRGPLENSVSILHAWLFEHFLNPYPKDSEKIILARQTSLTRSQSVVEEMYKEEFADLEMGSISSSENTVKAGKGATRTSKDRGEEDLSDHVLDVHIAGSTTGVSFQYVTHGDAETEYGLLSRRTNQKSNADDSNLFPNAITHSDSAYAITHSDSTIDRFTKAATASYHMSALVSFGSGCSISVSLGLHHCEDGSIPISGGSHQNFIAMKANDIYNPAASSVGAETTDIEYINPGNRQNGFGSCRMLHDFVA